jgi:hypothetical protein
MTYRYVLMLGAAPFISFPPGCYAGPCSEQIAEMDAKVYAMLNARVPEGPGGKETSRPAEVKMRDLSTKNVEAAGDAMNQAREANLAGDKAACERALAGAQKAIDKSIEK